MESGASGAVRITPLVLWHHGVHDKEKEHRTESRTTQIQGKAKSSQAQARGSETSYQALDTDSYPVPKMVGPLNNPSCGDSIYRRQLL